MTKKVIMALSGGVDSSVGVHLLQQQGYEVLGLHLSNGKYGAAADGPAAQDAQAVADALGIRLHVADAEAEFDRVVEYFCSEYNAGRTPNPCCLCNRQLKFTQLLNYADQTGCDLIATGHYVRLRQQNNRHLLMRGLDQNKDQSYVLFYLTQQQLGRCIFPNGELTKERIRELAEVLNLPVKNKPESQEICFIPDDNYGRFLREQTPDAIRPGKVIADGTVVGEHPGIQHYTIGQRHGIGIAFGKPMYVIRLDADTNTVIMGPATELMSSESTVANMNWLISPPAEPIEAMVKIRYRSRRRPARIEPLPNDRARVVFEEPARSVTPGQAAVFYEGDTVLGGGWIE